MIRVALGQENFQFTRPLEWIDRAIDEGIIPKTEEVIVQAGTTKYSPRNANFKIFDFVDYDKQMEDFKNARIGIIHAGMGNILDFVDLNRVPIIIPRDPKLNEHLDNHQFEFCEVAKEELNLPIVYTYEEFIKELQSHNNKRVFPSMNKQLVDYLVSVVEN